MDESRKAFEAARKNRNMFYETVKMFPTEQWRLWQAAEAWARQDERERLAKLNESLDDPLTSDEIRAGRIDGND